MNNSHQYTIGKIAGIWLSVTFPMGFAAWVIPVLLSSWEPLATVVMQTAALTAGLIWQFVLTLILVRHEEGEISWSVLADRLWLRTPKNPITGKRNARQFFWCIPLLALYGIAIFFVAGLIDPLWVRLFPFFKQPPHLGIDAVLAVKDQLVGAWWFYALFLTLSLFNVFLGEGLLFHGILLPKMEGVFGKYDWIANGVIFALYHVHQPWTIGYNIVVVPLLLSLPVKLFKSNWVGIIIHSLQFVMVAVVFFLIAVGNF